jgi:class 3 adenylate cyclase
MHRFVVTIVDRRSHLGDRSARIRSDAARTTDRFDGTVDFDHLGCGMVGDRPETVTILFTDVVGSTAWRAPVGDVTTDARMAEFEHARRDVVASLAARWSRASVMVSWRHSRVRRVLVALGQGPQRARGR